MRAFVALAAGLAVAVATTPLAAAVARRLDVMDHPGPLKVHAVAVPYLGGLAVFCALLPGVGWARPGLLVPIAIALLLGLVDDAVEVPPRVRLLAEVGVGATAGLVVPTRLPDVVGPVAVAVAVVVLINAVNLIDGLDGLASGVACVSAVGFAALLVGDSQVVALALAGALAGFLLFNRPPARIYLGDAGAYLLGTALALLLALSWDREGRLSVPVAALLLVAVPVLDTGVAVLRRMRAGQPLFVGDRGHVYDQLVDRGWSAPRAAAVLVLLQAVLAAVAAAAAHLPTGPATAVVVLSLAALVVLAAAGGFLATTYRRTTS
ncbi:MAG: UDP-GlcNAc:undecaprenyl-phosphate/decaprenyl-phosphate GlcNAc-phosphate transferase [Acidimicrobiaceae bacterium]|jgi:UDP-GlcNAc:undecaprenyl-phosphate GlcNAc-1-phosphate transferase